MRYLVLLLLIACSNDAIRTVETSYPGAVCKAVNTQWISPGYDTAVCIIDGESWFVTIKTDGGEPRFDKLHGATRIGEK